MKRKSIEVEIPTSFYPVTAPPIPMKRQVKPKNLTVQIPTTYAVCDAPRIPMGGDAAALPWEVDVCRGALRPPSPKKKGFFPPGLGPVVAPPPVVVAPALPVVVSPEQKLLEDMRELMRNEEAACLVGSVVMTDK